MFADDARVAAIDTYFGQQVKQLRAACGFSQEELAFLAGISGSYLGRLERGEKSPTIGIVQKVAEALGMSTSELMRTVDESMANESS